MKSLEALPSLVLNADFRPVSYHPLSLLGWQDTIRLVYQDKVNVVATYDRVVRSPSLEMDLPSVISVKEYVNHDKLKVAFNRFNVFLRDIFTCQYCGDPKSSSELTFDHVVPRSKGGETKWDNIVAACADCNTKKNNHLPSEIGMKPLKTPRKPTPWELKEAGRKFPPKYLHESWLDYLYWDTELRS